MDECIFRFYHICAYPVARETLSNYTTVLYFHMGTWVIFWPGTHPFPLLFRVLQQHLGIFIVWQRYWPDVRFANCQSVSSLFTMAVTKKLFLCILSGNVVFLCPPMVFFILVCPLEFRGRPNIYYGPYRGTWYCE